MSAFSAELSIELDKCIGKATEMMATYRRGLGTIEETHRLALYTRIEALMAEEEDLYKQLELELRGNKAALAEKKNVHNQVNADFMNVKNDHQRTMLIAGGSSGKTAYRDAQKEKLEASQRK